MPSRRSSRRRQSLALPGDPPGSRTLRRLGKRTRSKRNIYASTRRRSSSPSSSTRKRKGNVQPMSSPLRNVKGLDNFLNRFRK